MAAQKRKDEINLLPEKGFESTTTGRILAWILSTFRVIVIVTEIIVMVAFLSRFWLDAQNSDLNEQIQQKQAVLVASQNFENEFKLTQKRLQVFNNLTNQTKLSETLNKVTLSLPPDVILTNIVTTKSSVEINGNTPNEKSIQQLSINLNSREGFSEFTVTKITTSIEDESVLDFTVSGKQK